jgi:hypothetical protein
MRLFRQNVVSLLAAAAVSAAAQQPPAIDRLLTEIASDGVVTRAEVSRLIEAMPTLPPGWSEQANRIVRLATDREGIRFEVDAERWTLGERLTWMRGYALNSTRFTEEWGERAIAGHTEAPDRLFDAIAGAAGRPAATDVVALIHYVKAVDTSPNHEVLWVNPGEIPGNGRDDDGNGYVDDVHGANITARNGDVVGRNFDPTLGFSTRFKPTFVSRGAPRVKVMMVTLDDRSDLVEALRYPVSEGARIVYIPTWTATSEAAEEHLERGLRFMQSHPEVLFVVSPRDGGRLQLDLYPPAEHIMAHKFDNYMVVTSAGADGELFDDGGQPAANWSRNLVTHALLANPVNKVYGPSSPDRYDYTYAGADHASQAAAGLAARLRILDPGLGPVDLKSTLRWGTRKSEHWQPLVASGGIVDPERAMRLAAVTGLVRRGASVSAAIAQMEVPPGEAEFYRDAVAAILAPNVTGPSLTAEGRFIVTGQVDPASRLLVDGREVPITADGAFEWHAPLASGQASVLVEAFDPSGNRTQRQVPVR